jgi:hypothetical protein
VVEARAIRLSSHKGKISNEHLSSKGIVLPAAIPFADLKRQDLEECVFWLMDAMGAKDLEWRLGGTGGGGSRW